MSELLKNSLLLQERQESSLFQVSYRALAYHWLPSGYCFCHSMMLIFGIWVVIQPSSHDANQVVMHLSSGNTQISALNIVICIKMSYPTGFVAYFRNFQIILRPYSYYYI